MNTRLLVPRLDSILSVHVVRPLLSAFGCRHRGLPILMYHSISGGSAASGQPRYYETCTSLDRFAEQMMFLRDNGYKVIRMGELNQHLQTSGLPEAKCVVITFDDGYRDFLTGAHPLLKQHGFPAMVYLPTSYIGEDPRRFKERDCLTWNDVKILSRAGITFGSHTVTHPKLVDLSWAEIETELSASKADIERHVDCAVTDFSYPYAFPEADLSFKKAFRDLLARLGYMTCVTTRVGRIKRQYDPLCLKRLPVNTYDDLKLFRAKLEGAYDWLSVFQSTFKNAKRILSGHARSSY